jgi:hypothetical protein
MVFSLIGWIALGVILHTVHAKAQRDVREKWCGIPCRV